MADTQLDGPHHEADVNAKDWPAYPMRQKSGLEHQGMAWERPTQQEATVKILKSNERPSLSAVFGTTVPPSGLSGQLRRMAYGFSESNIARWVTLVLADRVNMVEGVLDDLRRGHLPDIAGEMGMRSELKHNARGVAIKAAVGIVAISAIAYLLTRRRR